MYNITQQYSTWRNDFLSEATELATKGLPRKVLELNEVLDLAFFRASDLDEYRLLLQDGSDSSGSNGEAEPLAVIPALPNNGPFREVTEKVTKIVRECINEFNLVKMWIKVLRGGGNNSAEFLKRTAIEHIENSEYLAWEYLDFFADIDANSDENLHFRMCYIVKEIRYNYIFLHDIVTDIIC